MPRVLIVDDKEENVYYLQALLSGHGFGVDTARHGAEALIKARQAVPDLVVSDLLMPVMDGYTLLRHWKADARLRDKPFIVYTATYTNASDEKLALDLGADAFILKPCEPEVFMARIREVQAHQPKQVPITPQPPSNADEKALLKLYSETLIRKLEEKTLQLEDANQALQGDIAERKRTEENLRESEERFRATFEQAAVGIAHVDVDGRFLRVNDKLCEIVGYSRDELLHLQCSDLMVAEDRSSGDEARLAILTNKQDVFSTESRYCCKSGERVWVSIVTTLLRGAAGEPKYFITVIADITERRALEEQFLRAQRMESIGTLAGGIAHDLNNLLSPILMGIGLLRRQEPSNQSQRIIDGIERSAKRGAELVRQVLSFSRGVEGARVAVHLGHIVREVHAILRNTFPKNIDLITDVAADTQLVMGDPTQLNQVLLNLCVNARDAMLEGGRLMIVVRNVDIDGQSIVTHGNAMPGAYVMIEVTDTGSGMSRKVIERIFEPFYTTKEVGKGTGLGLSTVLGIVRSHGGFLNVDSELGRGSVFKIFLPMQLDASLATPIESTSEVLPRGQGELILLVDDETAIVAVAKSILELFGYRTLTANNGAEALQIFERHRNEVALVLTDMAMPVTDGPALIASLRNLEPNIRIIASSGISSSSNEAETWSVKTGVKNFLPKPYTAESLLGMLHAVLR